MSAGNQALPMPGQTFIKKLQELDLEPIAYQLMQFGWSQEQTSRAIMHYQMFLFLVYLHPNIQLAPTQEIDWVWHYHILHTRKYRKDCQMLFGRFIEHEPDCQLRGKANSHSLDTAFAQTQALFEQYFGKGALGNTLGAQLDRLELAEYRPQRQCDRPNGTAKCDRPKGTAKCDRAQTSLRYHRSACGRPSSLGYNRSSFILNAKFFSLVNPLTGNDR